MSWRVEGTFFGNCSCDMVCPCTTSTLSLPGDTERCLVALFFNVASGEVEGVDVSGLTVAIVADAPQLMSEGNWRVGVVIDAAASDAQAPARRPMMRKCPAFSTWTPACPGSQDNQGPRRTRSEKKRGMLPKETRARARRRSHRPLPPSTA